jgi:hypothetical protein
MQELTYWRPVKMMTIDVMHTFILGILKDFSINYLNIVEVGNLISPSGAGAGSMKGQSFMKRKESEIEADKLGQSSKRGKKSEATSGQMHQPQEASLEGQPLQQASSSHISHDIPMEISSSKSHSSSREISPSASHSGSSASSLTSGVRRSLRLVRLDSPGPPNLRQELLKRAQKGKGKAAITSSDPESMGISHSNASSGGHEPAKERSHSRSSVSCQSSMDISSDNDNQKAKLPSKLTEMSLKIEELWSLQKKIQEVTIPSWVTRLPNNIGTASAGTPKAAEWLILYTVHFVLILIPKWHEMQSMELSREKKLLKTTTLLISIINYVMSHSIPQATLQKLDTALLEYRESLLKYWGQTKNPKPTLHYAQHITEIIRRFGPPSIFSTWSGERINHMMTEITKNKNKSQSFCTIIYKGRVLTFFFGVGFLDQSLFDKFLQKANLMGLVEQLPQIWTPLGFEQKSLPNLWEILYVKNQSIDTRSRAMSSEIVNLLKIYLQETMHELPLSFSPNELVGCRHIPFRGNHVSAHKYHHGDSQISFKKEISNIQYGRIVEIVCFKSIRKFFLLVEEYPIFLGPKHRNPYADYPMLQAQVVYKDGGSKILIEENMVTGHLASMECPVGSFGEERKMLFVVSLHFSVSLFISLLEHWCSFCIKSLTHRNFSSGCHMISHKLHIPHVLIIN